MTPAANDIHEYQTLYCVQYHDGTDWRTVPGLPENEVDAIQLCEGWEIWPSRVVKLEVTVTRTFIVHTCTPGGDE